MYGEYGYMEEGKLGKPYDLGLLRRLFRYALPYKKTIAVALCLTTLITALDLALPYLSKIVIDRYILAAWYRVNLSGEAGETPRDLGNKLEKSGDGKQGFISNEGLKKLDSVLVHDMRKEGILSEEPFYRISPDLEEQLKKGMLRERTRLGDGSLMVPIEDLKSLGPKILLKVRAKDLRGLRLVALVLIGFLLCSFWLGYGEYYLMELIGQKMMQDIRLQLFERMQSQALRFFDRHPVGRLVTRVTNDIENLNEMFKSVASTLFKDIFILGGILLVLLYLNWKLALSASPSFPSSSD